MPTRWCRAVALACGCVVLIACRTPSDTRLTFSGSSVGAEGVVLRRQVAAFEALYPHVRVDMRPTPDAADQRHQLYVQWLNAHVPDPDVLQLDTIWTAEFAAAQWIAPLDRFAPEMDDFIPAAVAASRWRGTLYAVPWFVDAGLLYWRTDLIAAAPVTLAALRAAARESQRVSALPFGLVWQGARYEGLVTVFVEHLAAFGGSILDERGAVTVDRMPAIRALAFMRDAIWADGWVPSSVLTWQEEQTRFAFQNGQAVFMRNWPYAWTLMQNPKDSRVAGKVAVAAFPSATGGGAAAALGGAELAVNAHSAHPALASALVAFLTASEQMAERALVASQLPARRSVYDMPRVISALPAPAAQLQAALDAAIPRPVTPVYTELSEILQVWLHRALTRQQEPADALRSAAADIRALLARSGLDGEQPR